MLIDWTTARIPLNDLSDSARNAALSLGDRICCYCPKTGEVRYESFKWESIKSDSHQISVKAGTDLWVQGSPARVIGEGDAVFGAGASAALDLLGCVDRMVSYLAGAMAVDLPPAHLWKVTRVDVTGNLQLSSQADVRSALSILRGCEGGRYRVSQQAGDTVYWSHTSKMRSGKAYAKGPHLVHLMKQKTYQGLRYTQDMIAAANSLLRLELKLGREWFARHHWQSLTADDFKREWSAYFERMIGEADMSTDENLHDVIARHADTPGQCRAAYGCWLMIQSQGWERARQCYVPRTWYRHLKTLRAAGLGDADIAQGQIVPLRRRVMSAQMVNSWSQIAA